MGRSPGTAPRPCEEMLGGARRREAAGHEEGELQLQEGRRVAGGGGPEAGDDELVDPDSLTYIVSDASPSAFVSLIFLALSLRGLD